MKKYPFIYYAVFILMLLLLGNSMASAQKVFSALPANATTAETMALKKIFKRQTVVQLDAAAVYQYIKQAGPKSNMIIDIGNNYHWDITLEQHDLRSGDYLLQRNTDKALVTLKREDCYTYAGYLKGNTNNYVRLNIQDQKLSGNIMDNGRSIYIEPLKKFIPSAPADKYVIYKRGDSHPIQGRCSQDAAAEQQVNEKLSSLAAPLAADCRKIEIATDSDWENYLQGVTAADIVGNLNFVEPLYQNYFGASIVVKYQHEWATFLDPYTGVSLCADTDDRLDEFRLYWQTNYTWVKRDISILYSGVDFTGSTIGCAPVGAFSGSTSDACYTVVQWKTSYSDEGREVLVAHEMGHIFGCSHDVNGCDSDNGPIMCPSINAACTDNCIPYWSFTSITAIANSMGSTNGSSRLRTREFFQPVNSALLLGVAYTFTGNDVYVASSNVVNTGLFGNGSIIYSGTDNVTLQPGFSAVIHSGTGSVTAKPGPCNIDGQLMPGVGQRAIETTAIQSALKQNIIEDDPAVKVYPNPFSSIANIEIVLPKTANISLSVYDLAGRLMDNPVKNKPMAAGKHTITYTNKWLKPTVYLFVIETNGKKFTQKLLKM